MSGALLHCPIRGRLNIPEKAADGLTYSEEKRRIDCIKFLLAKGYPDSHIRIETVLLRFGHKGKNSFRTDLAVLDAPVSSLPSDVEELKPHIKLIAEIKRDNADSKLAKDTQIKPALDFIHNLDALAVYWDDTEQRLFYRTVKGRTTTTHETALAVLPRWRQALSSPSLKCADLRVTNLHALFERIEQRLHTEVADKSARFEIMLQLLIAKLFDEHSHPRPDAEMLIQDFTDAPLGDPDVLKVFNSLLKSALVFYQKYLPKRVPEPFTLSGAMLRSISSLLAPVKILGSRRDVVQDFYMYFAQGVYKWDLAQYFTPSEVVDFIVALVSPQAGDHVKDPACGSGDFLISALHYSRALGGDLRDAIWGADTSDNAVQVSVLNMVLNGDGKSNILKEDSLEHVEKYRDSFSVVLCNPPFGIRIKEHRFEVLQKFDLAHDWTPILGTLQPTPRVMDSQETGILFAELCVSTATPGGRVGIILPNGYLGNRSVKYLAFREWLLRHARVVAIVAFPRFTFKKSGADVSASVLVVEKRKEPLIRAADSEDYPFYTGLLESVGWSVGDKKAERIYKRDPETGDYLTDYNNDPLVDADFGRVLQEYRHSKAAEIFPWITTGDQPTETATGWSKSIKEVLARPDLSLDPKRWCERVTKVRESIVAGSHFSLGEILDVVEEEGRPNDGRAEYQLVEIQDTTDGVAVPTTVRGWHLPDRSRHRAHQGDIFVGKVWSSVGKWFVAGGDCSRLVVSNGFHRLKLRPNTSEYLIDLVAGLNTEGYRIQARAFCTGSDGLADLPADSVREIVLPRVTDPTARTELQVAVNALLAGRSTIAGLVGELIGRGNIRRVVDMPRSSHVVQV